MSDPLLAAERAVSLRVRWVRRVWRAGLHLCGWTCLAALSAGAAAFGWMQWPEARSYLAHMLEEAAGVRVEGVAPEGIWPLTFRARRVTLVDPCGDWLQLDQAAYAWELHVFPFTLKVTRLSAERATVLRPPAYASTPEDPAPAPSLREQLHAWMQALALAPETEITLNATEVRLPFLKGTSTAGRLEGEIRLPGLSRLTWRGASESRADVTLNVTRDAPPSLHMEAAEHAGGPWAVLAGVPGPLGLKADVAPETAADGAQGLRWRAKGAAGDMTLEAEGGVFHPDAGGLRAETAGTFRAAREGAALPAHVREIIGDHVTFTMRAQADPDGGWRVPSAEALGANFRVRAEGLAYEQGKVAGWVRAEAGATLTQAAGGNGALTADLRLGGSVQAPELTGTLHAEAAGAGFGPEAAALAGHEITLRATGKGVDPLTQRGDVEAEVKAAGGTARLRGTLPGKDGSLRAEADLSLTEASVLAVVPRKGIAPGPLIWHAEAERQASGVVSATLKTAEPFAGVMLQGNGRFDPFDQGWRAELNAAAPSLQEVRDRLAPEIQAAPAGKVSLHVTASGTGAARTAGTLEAAFEGLRVDSAPPEATAVMGEAPRLSAAWETEGQSLRIPRAELLFKRGRLSLEHGAVSAQGEGLAGDLLVSLTVPDGTEAGRAALAAGLSVEGKAHLAGSAAQPSASTSWRLIRRGALVDLAFKAERTAHGAKVQDIRLSGPAGVSASGEASLTDGAPEGALTLTVPDTAALGRAVGVSPLLGGALHAEMRAARQGSADSVLADVAVTGLDGFGVRAEEARLHAELKDVAALAGLRFTLSARGAGPSPAKPGDVTGNVTCEGQGSAMDLTARCALDGKGQGIRAASLKAEGRWRKPQGAKEGTAEALQLDARLDDLRLSLTEPGVIHVGDGTAYPERLRFKLNEGSLTLEGAPPAKGADALPALTLRAEHVRLTPFLPERETELSGTVRLSGTRPAPLLDVDLSAADPAVADAISSVRLTAHAGGGTGTVRLLAEPRGGGLPLAALNASVPLTFSLAPFRCDLAPDAPLSGDIRADADLARPAALFLPSGQDLRGHLRGNVTLAGTVSRPLIRGALRAEGVAYTHEAAGVALDHGVLELTARDASPLALRGEFRAGAGKASLAGTAGVTAPYPFDVQLSADHAELPRSSLAHGVTQGQLRLKGTPEALTLAGALTFSPMEITLPDLPPSSSPAARIRNPEALPIQPQVPPPAPKPSAHAMPKIGLNVELNVPGQVYISGRGLQTELRGKVNVTGTAAAPFASGQLRAVHGSFTLLDRELTVTEGVLRFSGAVPPSPYVTFKAETFTKELKAGIALEGPASDPTLRLTSEPVRPEDEILAHLLFGRELKSITPLQGVKLARAAAQLRGGGGGGGGLWDITGKARALLGVDKLNVEQNESGEYEAGAGKYIGDKIYVGVQSGADPAKGRVTTETEITPNMTVETETGREGGGVRLNWKKDY